MRGLKVFAVVLLVLLATLAIVGPAFAQYEEPPQEQPTVIEEAPAPRAPSPAAGGLAVTGAEITLFALIGLAAIGTGAVIVRRTREARAAQR